MLLVLGQAFEQAPVRLWRGYYYVSVTEKERSGHPGRPNAEMTCIRAFAAGLVLDALEERAFPAEHTGGSTPLSWNGRFSEIPPVLLGRMRRPVDPESDR